MTSKEYDKILTKNFLINEYIDKKKTIKQISLELNCGQQTISKRLHKFNIAIDNSRHKYKILNLINQKFGDLTVTKLAYINKHSFWECKCICGNTKIVQGNFLKAGNPKSCGCRSTAKRYKDKPNTYIGESFLFFLKQTAKRRNKNFEITLDILREQFLKQNYKCIYLGEKLHFDICDNNGKMIPRSSTASVDRINSSIGYTKDNIQITHKNINMMKQQFSHEKFLEYIGKIYHNCQNEIEEILKKHNDN